MPSMKPYPVELRERIVAAVDQSEATIKEIAGLFNVTERYVYKLLKQQNKTGDLSPLPHAGGARSKLTDRQKLKVAELVAQMPDATLEQLRRAVEKRLRVQVSVSTVWNVLDVLDLTLKKSPAARAKRIPNSAPSSEKGKRDWMAGG
jgi:transposase